MKRSQRLNPVVDIAAKTSQAALEKVGQANSLWLQDKQQLDDLYRYKEEYLAKFRQGDALVMSAQKILELRAFLVQLDQAITAQQQQVKMRLSQLEQERAHWMKARTKEEVMLSLLGRYQQEERLQISKKEQLDNDERNTSLWLRRRK